MPVNLEGTETIVAEFRDQIIQRLDRIAAALEALDRARRWQRVDDGPDA